MSACVANGVPDQPLIDKTLKELMVYADKHFIDEELLMLHSHVDVRHVNVHRMEHRSFVYDIQSMWEHLCSEEDLMDISEKLVRFVTSWLTYHILGIDQIMAAQIFAIHHGTSPAEAYKSSRDIKYASETAHLRLDSVLVLWRISMERYHKLEAELEVL